MNDIQFEAIIKEKAHVPLWVMTGCAILVGVGILVGGYVYYIHHKQYPVPEVTSFVLSDALKAKVDYLVERDENQKKLFMQLDSTTLPTPGDIDDFDRAAYVAALQGLSTSSLRASVATDTIEQVFTVGTVPFGTFLGQQTDRTKYDQLFNNLRTTVGRLSSTFKQPPLYKRFSDVMVVGSSSDNFVYPSLRVAEGYLTAAIATAINVQTAEHNQQTADDFAQRGMLYGWYGQSDIDATKLFMDEYLAKIPLRDYLTVTTEVPAAH